VEEPTIWMDVTPEHHHLEAQLDALGIRVVRTPLATGDCWWIGHNYQLVMAELKRVEEAINSFATGRMLDQLYRMHETADVPILLMSGYLVPSPSGFCRVMPKTAAAWNDENDVLRVRYDAFHNYLAGLMREGIIVERLERRELLAKRLISIMNWTKKSEHKTLRPSLTRPATTLDRVKFQKMAKLMSTTGIGEELAERLLMAYDDSPWKVLKDVVEGDSVDAAKVLGIGKKKLQQIRKEWL